MALRNMTPLLADRIGVSGTPVLSLLDVLAEAEPDRALRLAYAMAQGYRDVARAALDRIREQHTEIERLRQRVDGLIGELRQARKIA